MRAVQQTKDTPVIDLVKAGNFNSLKIIIEEIEGLTKAESEDSRKNAILGMVGETDDLGRTPLHYVCNLNDITSSMAIANFLLDKHASARSSNAVSVVNAQDSFGMTPLHRAVGALSTAEGKGKFIETTMMMQCLLARGADWKIKDNKNYTAFTYYAAYLTPDQILDSVCAPLTQKNMLLCNEFVGALEEFVKSGGYKDLTTTKQPKKKGGCELM